MNASREVVVNMASKGESEEVRKRTREVPSWAPGQPDYDPRLPYGPKVYLARRKKADPWWVTSIEVRHRSVYLSSLTSNSPLGLNLLLSDKFSFIYHEIYDI